MDLRRDVFQAIAEPTRRTILELLAANTMTAGAIASSFDSARSTVSKHLQILTECELLKQESKGREIYYELNPFKMKEVTVWAEQFRELWEGRLNRMDAVLKKRKNNRQK
jgi:DNA-binding transcriptional ArsR family regulator